MTVAIAAQKLIHETHRVDHAGAVDADGHILEPPTLWEEYIDPAFRDGPCASWSTRTGWRSSRSAGGGRR